MACGCCSPLRARYKRLVDNIYPDYAEDGLVNANMQKLIYYAATSPEKWDRIGEYLAYRIGKDLNRTYPRFGFVVIGMEAMDQLLMTCQSQHINLYVESYLKTVQKLLESPEPDMQVRASESFLQFAQKEEDVPAYHIRYDFFISKFSQMCHFETNNPAVTTKIRVSGLQGIGGVVRKIESEDLADNIWDPTHMAKIIPSLLYNIQIGDYKAGHGRSQTPDLNNLSDKEKDAKSPLLIAEDTFRKLMGRARFRSIKTVMIQILNHLDIHQMWTPPDFADHVFQMVMFSIQQQVNYVIIEMLMAHLDKKPDDTMVRFGIATVLSRIFTNGAIDASVGPSVLETINALLGHLRTSVERAQGSRDPEPEQQRYHEALLTCLGEYSQALPNFQMLEIMMFILGKTPQTADPERQTVESELQHMLLKALLTVAEKFKPVQFSNTLPITFLSPLLEKLSSPDPDARLLVMRTLQTLVDRRGNLDRLDHPTVEPRSDLQAQKANSDKQDCTFVQKYGERIYRELVRALMVETDWVEFLDQFYITTALLLLECNSDENLRLQLELIGDLQELATDSDNRLRLSNANKFCLHATCISLLAVVSFVVRIPAIFEYKDRLVSLRRQIVPHLLPPLEEDYSPDLDPAGGLEEALIDLEPVRAALLEAGRWAGGPRAGRAASPGIRCSPRNSWVGPGSASVIRRPSGVSVMEVEVEVDSCASSPGLPRRQPVITAELSFVEMKRALEGKSAREREAEERARSELVQRCHSLTFPQLVQQQAALRPARGLQQCLAEIYSGGAGRTEWAGQQSSVGYDTTDLLSSAPVPAKPMYEEYFPELFSY